MAKQWLKPSECAEVIGHKTPEVILGAIKDKKLEHRARVTKNGRTRYLVHVDDLQRWFDAVWRRSTRAS